MHEMPGGAVHQSQKAQAKSLGLEDRWHEVAGENLCAGSTQLFGDIVKVTPSSKVVGGHGAVHGHEWHGRRWTCSIRTRETQLPRAASSMIDARLSGLPPTGGWPKVLAERIILDSAGVKTLERPAGREGCRRSTFEANAQREFGEAKSTMSRADVDCRLLRHVPAGVPRLREASSRGTTTPASSPRPRFLLRAQEAATRSRSRSSRANR